MNMKPKIIAVLEKRLLTAAQAGNTAEVRDLLAFRESKDGTKFSIHATTREGLTPLLLAVKGQHLDCVALLIAARSSLVGTDGKKVVTWFDVGMQSCPALNRAILKPRSVPQSGWITEHRGDAKVGTLYHLRDGHFAPGTAAIKKAIWSHQLFVLKELIALYDIKNVRDFFLEGHSDKRTRLRFIAETPPSIKEYVQQVFLCLPETAEELTAEQKRLLHTLSGAPNVFQYLRAGLCIHPTNPDDAEKEALYEARFRLGVDPDRGFLDYSESLFKERAQLFFKENPGRSAAVVFGSLHALSRHCGPRLNVRFLSKDCG